MQPRPGVYNEENIRRLDLALAAAAEQGIRLILVLGNYWPFNGAPVLACLPAAHFFLEVPACPFA